MHGIVSRRMASAIRKAYETGLGNGCDKRCIKIHVVAHSQGAAITVNSMSLLSEEIRESIYFVGLGGQLNMPNYMGLGEIRNIRNEHDIVPQLPNHYYDLPFIKDPKGEIFDPVDYGYAKGSEDGFWKFSAHTLGNESTGTDDGAYYKYLSDEYINNGRM